MAGSGGASATGDGICGSSEGGVEDSSGSDSETEPAKVFHRRISTNRDIKSSACVKGGYLLKQKYSFQRWRRRYFKLKGRKLYYAKTDKSVIFDEIDLSDLSVAEMGPKNANHSFQVITPFRCLVLCAETRKDMEEWIAALKSQANSQYFEGTDHHMMEFLSGQHHWFATSHARPTYCNICREALSGVTSYGLSCEVCKFKVHKKCATKSINNCKWTTLTSVGKVILDEEAEEKEQRLKQAGSEDSTMNVGMPHQWMEGNLPVSAKCSICDKTCGSVLRLQDWRCLWCKDTVHTSCRPKMPSRCPLGPSKVSIIPPTALHSIGIDDAWEVSRPTNCSPLLVFVNSKSGDNLGVKFLRRFKQLLNPAQVFDLMNGGPKLGLCLFRSLNPFRILVCGGDGSVSWVLSEIDKLTMQIQCQLGVLPLGTGNDLARVLGWGSVCDTDTHLSHLIEKYEKATTKMLDRWSVLVLETQLGHPEGMAAGISAYEDSVVQHLSQILNSEQYPVVIESARVLCQTVKDFISRVGETHQEPEFREKCQVLKEKLDSLLHTLQYESLASRQESESSPVHVIQECPVFGKAKKDAANKERSRRRRSEFIQREALMSRANSLKKAVRQIIEHAEKAVDDVTKIKWDPESIGDVEAAERAEDLPKSNKTETEDEDIPESTLEECETGGTSTRRISSGSMLGTPRHKGTRKTLPIINPLVSLPTWPNISGSSMAGGLVSQVLMANADALCAAATPLMDCETLDGYQEKCTMNNYFGIGFDAKITLDFHNKREKHPEKCRSRTKNFMWYGVLGSKELLQKTYKNLEQRVHLECDGERIPLPSLQGIVILNIPSFMGGINFWGGSKEDDCFLAPSFDDRILEVVAVFGSIQMAASRIIRLQHHRIAQCSSITITILGSEGVPVEVDGEAWIQPPGVIRIVHKNRSMMMARNRHLETSLRQWEEKQAASNPGSPKASSSQIQSLSDEEQIALANLLSASTDFMRCAQDSEGEMEEFQRYYDLIEKRCHQGKLPEGRGDATELIVEARELYTNVTSAAGKNEESVLLEQHGMVVQNLDAEIRRWCFSEQTGFAYLIQAPCLNQEKKKSGLWKLKLWHRTEQAVCSGGLNVLCWSADDVAAWLTSMQLDEYKHKFVQHDIRGAELLNLDRNDLKELGIKKVGHIKRILQGIKDLQSQNSGKG